MDSHAPNKLHEPIDVLVADSYNLDNNDKSKSALGNLYYYTKQYEKSISFYEKIINPPTNLANGAVYIFSAEFLNLYSEKFNFATDFSTEILGLLVGKIYSYETTEMFLDIGTPESYAKANSNFVS